MADQTFARYVNERRILTQLRLQGAMPRAELARRLGLTPATITNLVENLTASSLLVERRTSREDNARRDVGRPGVDITLNPSGGYFLGAEIGVGVVRFALIDLALGVVDSRTARLAHPVGPEAAVDAIATYARGLAQPLRSIGITVPGLVRSDGYVVHLPMLGWKDLNLKALAEQALSAPVFVENNAHAAAFGEVYTQPGLQADAIVYLKLGAGCGGAAIVNGRLVRGAGGTGNEFGHIRIRERGPRCSCGQEGCLETFVNIAALDRFYRPGQGFGVDSLSALPAMVAAAAHAGDRNAGAAIDELADHLIIGLTSLTNIFNPSTIVLGGAMRPVLAARLDRLSQAVGAGIVPGMTRPQIRLSTLGEMECAIGAATIAHHQDFDVSNIEIGG
ncbi:ROK family transcriptional regulator [Labrys sp. ZIDIC5]|uniref:ROK family transcriptional regulator n=1 Tax=Labrys sedimenti TaxID=3106036 RepID=UPI002ACA82A5|nr:ROK family transcriptional regulator [Labrys sp. ZIDIC5]MDZ5452849.1 ROK family transcriptional regulator [Labrys sp. ZIDIC5]